MKIRKRMCKICRTKFTPRESFQQWCNYDCAIKLSKLNAKKKQRKEDAKTRQRLKPRSKHLAECQVVFNKFIRQTKMKNCITCGAPDTPVNPIQAGHFHSVGSRPHLRFEPLNVWPQCTRCNMHNSGDTAQFRLILEANLSKEEMDMLDGPGKSDWDISEIQAIRDEYKVKLKNLNTK